ncbi:hypothetical protein Riv7116_2113 [Rivularia sp. PCC 7116]|nr:hypothetical protein Riv7116_2113 [Rivularia sp. PCC 7116]
MRVFLRFFWGMLRYNNEVFVLLMNTIIASFSILSTLSLISSEYSAKLVAIAEESV